MGASINSTVKTLLQTAFSLFLRRTCMKNAAYCVNKTSLRLRIGLSGRGCINMKKPAAS